MISSRIEEKDVILTLYQSDKTVFRLNDVAMLTDISDFNSLNRRLHYYVKTGKLLNPRKGIYTKPDFSPEELACSVYAPSYISLEYVLAKEGILFQYDSSITSVSYLSRNIIIENKEYRYRKIKDEILMNDTGIILKENMSIATPERALLDLLYLEKGYYIDNLQSLNREKIHELLEVYQSKTLSERVFKLFA